MHRYMMAATSADKTTSVTPHTAATVSHGSLPLLPVAAATSELMTTSAMK